MDFLSQMEMSLLHNLYREIVELKDFFQNFRFFNKILQFPDFFTTLLKYFSKIFLENYVVS